MCHIYLLMIMQPSFIYLVEINQTHHCIRSRSLLLDFKSRIFKILPSKQVVWGIIKLHDVLPELRYEASKGWVVLLGRAARLSWGPDPSGSAPVLRPWNLDQLDVLRNVSHGAQLLRDHAAHRHVRHGILPLPAGPGPSGPKHRLGPGVTRST